MPRLHRRSLGLGLVLGLLLGLLPALLHDASAEGDDLPPPKPRPLNLLPEHRPGLLIDDAFALPNPAPDPTVRPDGHSVDFLRRHASQARANPEPCASCHTETECRDCHRSTLRPLPLHPPGYIALHAAEAAKRPDACTTCHPAQTFCRDCHAASRLGASGAARPLGNQPFHPPSWLGDQPGASHAAEARRNLNACASCHQERDCLKCHVNVNPHPPAWINDCRPIASRNPRACLQCHADPAVLQRCL